MNILSVVTSISDDGAYGGPVRVAVNQAEALAASGNVVTLVAASPDVSKQTTKSLADGRVVVRTFRQRSASTRLGFAGTFSPALTRWLLKETDAFDVMHLHLARDLITIPAALIARHHSVPVVAQTHGMIDESGKVLAKLFDPGLTRPALRMASSVLFLTDTERSSLLKVEPKTRLVRLPNGVPQYRRANSGVQNVLFLSRLHQRKNPKSFALAALELEKQHPEWTFSIAGPDAGELTEVLAVIGAAGTNRIHYEGAIDPTATQERLRSTAIFVLPSDNEPFPMAALEAMASGVPCVVTETCGLAPNIRRSGAGIVIRDGSPAAVSEAIDALIRSADQRREMGESGLRLVREEFGMPRIAARLESEYATARESARLS